MPGNVWILDSTWPPEDLKQRQGRFPDVRHIGDRTEIQDQVRKLAKNASAGLDQDFWFVHQSDVGEVAQLLDPLLQSDNFRLFSGASAGVHEGLLPRSLVQRQLEDFLRYWAVGERESARQVLVQPDWWIDKIRVWSDRVQHDYVNLLAPIDLAATAFASGEVERGTYTSLRDQLTARLATKRDEFLKGQGQDIPSLTQVFQETLRLVRASDPMAKGGPAPLPLEERIGSTFTAQLLHVDDEIDNGWDLVMPALFDKYAYETNPERVVDRVAELHTRGDPLVVLLDLGLRSGDSPVPKAWRGINLLKDLRQRFRALPIYVFSARQDLHSYRLVLEAGGNGFIQKPCRALSSDSDLQVFARFRSQMLGARFDIFRWFLYRAFSELLDQINSGSLESKFEDPKDPRWYKRRQNLALALEELISADLERCTRDQPYANTAIRNLILGLFRPFEKENDPENSENSPSDRWKLDILKRYRNLCAHVGRGDQIANLDIRDVMLVAFLILDSNVLETPIPTSIRSHLDSAFAEIFFSRTPDLLAEVWLEAKTRTRVDGFLEKGLKYITPQGAFEKDKRSDHSLIALIADKILNPSFVHQDLALLNSAPAIRFGPPTPYQPMLDATPGPSTTSDTPVRAIPRRSRIKGLDYFFIQRPGGRTISFGQRYAGVAVDGRDPGQRSFFAWYYEKNMKHYLHEFSEEVLAFIGAIYGVGPQAGTALAPQHVEPPDSTGRSPAKTGAFEPASPPAHPQPKSPDFGANPRAFGISLFRLTASAPANPVGAALNSIVAGYAGSRLDRNRPGSVYVEQIDDASAADRWRGVHVRPRSGFSDRTRYLQITPTMSSIDEVNDDYAPITYTVADRLIKDAALHVPWLQSAPVQSDAFEHHGQLSPAMGALRPLDSTRLKEIFRNSKIAVADEIPNGNQAARTSWERALIKSSGVEVTSPDRADAIIVMIPENSPDHLLDAVHRRWEKSGRPWKAVSPSPSFKDWNVLVGLLSRFGPRHSTVLPHRERSPETLFLGLDLGHQRGVGSVLAAVLVNTRGQLLGWTRGPNPGRAGHTTAERIALQSFRASARALAPLMDENVERSALRLVIHRDGETLEQLGDFLGVLSDEFKIDSVDWIDVDKQKAPLFFLDSSQPSGQFVIFQDQSGRSEMWLRTTPGGRGLYARPLCITPRTSHSDLETLGLEVFDLSNSATQDYEMKAKLPVTTYLADGLSSTGSKAVSFWGYEHLYRQWDGGTA